MPRSASYATALALASMLLVGGAAHAQAGKPVTIDMQLSEFHFAPSHLDLTKGQTYLLRVTNDGKHAHSFSAKDFFKAVDLSPAASAKVGDGDIEVPTGQTVEVEVTAAKAGSYEMHCSHPLHSTLGMKGQIVIH